MEVLEGVVIARNFGHVKDGAAPSDPPHHSLLRRLKHTICHPFEDWQIMELNCGGCACGGWHPHNCHTMCGGSQNLGACRQWGGSH